MTTDFNYEVDIVENTSDVELKGVIIFIHGMAENKERYKSTLEYFASKGYTCMIADVIGHGKYTLEDKPLGFFGKDGISIMINNLHEQVKFAKNAYPNKPVYIIAHSMGTFIARTFLKNYDDEVDKVVLTGSPSDNIARPFGMLLIDIMSSIKGDEYISPLVANMVTGQFDKLCIHDIWVDEAKKLGKKAYKIDNVKKKYVKNSWICTKKEVVDAYNDSPLCGFSFTLDGYYNLMRLMTKTYSLNKWELKNKELPIMFLSGAKDPCRKDDKSFNKAVNTMRRVGYTNVDSKLIKDMRHEVFNEDYIKVSDIIINFFKK